MTDNGRSSIAIETFAIAVLVTILVFLLVFVSKAWAHDTWVEGQLIPAWVKAACCGPADAHHLTPDQIHGPMSSEEVRIYLPNAFKGTIPRSDLRWYVVDGYHQPVISNEVQPSQDGEYWIFYSDHYTDCGPEASCDMTSEHQSGVYCFFVPMSI